LRNLTFRLGAGKALLLFCVRLLCFNLRSQRFLFRCA
jgi:hypothetical protein